MNTLILIVVLGLFLQASSFVYNSAITKPNRAISRHAPHMIFDSIFSTSKIPANKKLCVITGTTSGLGKETLRSLLNQGDYYVICGCRDVEKMQELSEQEGFDTSRHTVVELDLGSFQSTKDFAKKVKSLKGNRPLEKLVCNAAVYQPANLKDNGNKNYHNSFFSYIFNDFPSYPSNLYHL